MKNFYAKVFEFINKVKDGVIIILIHFAFFIYRIFIYRVYKIYIRIQQNRIEKKNSNKDECDERG